MGKERKKGEKNIRSYSVEVLYLSNNNTHVRVREKTEHGFSLRLVLSLFYGLISLVFTSAVRTRVLASLLVASCASLSLFIARRIKTKINTY